MRHRSRLISFAVTAIAAVLFVLAGAGTAAIAEDYLDREVLPTDSIVAGIDVSGLTRTQACDLVNSEVAAPLLSPVTVTYEDMSFTLNTAQVVSVDVTHMVDTAFGPKKSATLPRRIVDKVTASPVGAASELTVSIDTATLTEWVQSTATSVATPAVDATTAVVGNKLVLTPSAAGISVDVTATVEALTAVLTSGEKEASLITNVVAPEVTEDELGPQIVIDLSQRRLYLYVNGVLEKTYGVAVGMASHPTPTGDFTIVRKRYMPTWTNPGSAWAADMPDTIAPGPDNPLGTRALNLNVSGIRIHGTSSDSSIGTAASHGCVRMHRWDIEDLYDRVEVGTQVHIVP